MSASVRRKSQDTARLVYFALFTSLVVVLQCMASFVFPKIGLSLNLSLIPVVLGVALCGKFTGAWLGFLSAFIILFDPTTVAFMTFDALATICLVLVKGIASGFVAGIVYDLMSRKNKSVAVILAAITAPVVNTAIFFGGCFAFFYDLISSWAEGGSIVWFVLTVMIGINFLIELLINTVFSPMIAKLIELGKK